MSSKPKHLYEYAVIRLVPDIEREEFVNVGLVMMCKRRRWLRQSIAIPHERLSALAPDFDCPRAALQLQSFGRIADGNPSAGPIAALEAHERFRWLTAVRSAVIQTSRPHPGLTDDLDATFENLFDTLVR